MEGHHNRSERKVRATLTLGFVSFVSLLVFAGSCSSALADQPVFTKDPGGVGVEVQTPGAQGNSRDGRPSDPRVTHVSRQFCVGPTGGGVTPAQPCAPTAVRTLRRAPTVTPDALAQQAYRFLPLPAPAIRTNPPPTQDQLAGLATWLWVDETTWGTRTATASIPGLAVTVTAVPVSVTWHTGDGGQVVCNGPGTPFTPAADRSGQQPSCSYIYRRSSAGQPGSRFMVAATTTWRIAWTATGATASGTLPPLSRTSQTALRVAEVQAINIP